MISLLKLVGLLSMLSQTLLALELEVRTPACEGHVRISESDDKSTLVNFENLLVKQGDADPFVRCRLEGVITIPQGFTTSEQSLVHARVNGHFDQEGDQAGGRLIVNMAKDSVRDSQIIQRGESLENLAIDLNASLLPAKACDGPRTMAINITIEALINYRLDVPSGVQASLDFLRIAPIIFSPISCPSLP